MASSRCIRSLSTAVRAKKDRNTPPSDLIEQLLKLKPRVDPEDVRQVLTRNRLDHKALLSTLPDLKEQKRFDLVGIVLSLALKAGALPVQRRETGS